MAEALLKIAGDLYLGRFYLRTPNLCEGSLSAGIQRLGPALALRHSIQGPNAVSSFSTFILAPDAESRAALRRLRGAHGCWEAIVVGIT